FYAGTYFPPDDRYAPRMPSFKNLLHAIIEAWRDRREQIDQTAGQVAAYLQGIGAVEGAGGAELTPELLEHALAVLRRAFDPSHGGFGGAPKFPHAIELRLLLRLWKRFGAADALNMVRVTLDHMARGGMYDQLGGGFHRYSVDERWLVPHFEKMLYDNALLAPAYAEAFLATGEPFYERIARETLDYVLREMTSPPGAFYSAQDADSEGVEGKFYVWSRREVEEALGKDEAKVFCSVYDVTEGGNFEGHNILHRPKTDEQDARLLGMPVEELRRRLAESRRKLYEVRSKRVWPGRDEKILTAWNGLMIAALAQVGAALDEPRYVDAARRAADFVLSNMRAADGKLFRTCAVGGPAKLSGYLEDYAFLADGLVTLYEADFDPRWPEAAAGLAGVILAEFADPAGPGFFYTGTAHEALITRAKDQHDGSTPSGNAMAVTALLRLGELTGRREFTAKAGETLRGFAGLMRQSPAAAGQMLTALDFHLGPVKEFAVVGPRDDGETRRVLRAVRGRYLPNKVVAYHDPAAGDPPALLRPLLEGRGMVEGRVTTYVCENYTCQAPLVGAEAVEQALRG
ncbi:MAG TPA: thioredoxin domain-containing protein, partial [Gemmataceae bacterium]